MDSCLFPMKGKTVSFNDMALSRLTMLQWMTPYSEVDWQYKNKADRVLN